MGRVYALPITIYSFCDFHRIFKIAFFIPFCDFAISIAFSKLLNEVKNNETIIYFSLTGIDSNYAIGSIQV
jgi:hypothetical protein